MIKNIVEKIKNCATQNNIKEFLLEIKISNIRPTTMQMYICFRQKMIIDLILDPITAVRLFSCDNPNDMDYVIYFEKNEILALKTILETALTNTLNSLKQICCSKYRNNFQKLPVYTEIAYCPYCGCSFKADEPVESTTRFDRLALLS